MPTYSRLLLLLPLLPALAAATGVASVENNCGFNSYLWSADPNSGGTEQTVAANGGTYSEVYRGSGISLKLALNSDPGAPYDPNTPLTQFQYTLDGATVYYALADMRGDPYAGYPVALTPSDPSCTTVSWPNGTAGPSAVWTCSSAANLTLTLC